MCARLLVFYVLVSHMAVSKCAIVNKINMEGIISDSKIELSPLLVSAGLDDIIIISVPMFDTNTLYYLNKPNGDVEELHLNTSRVVTDYQISRHYSNKYLKRESKIINPVNEYKILNFNYERNGFDIYKDKEKEIMSNDFMIGPLHESDHGNWVLSAYYKQNGEWIESFQVITIEIKEAVPASPYRPSLYPGEDFYVRFASPIHHLESCEIIAPGSTFDRYYGRDHLYLDSCGFLVPNVTRADEGSWRVIGVGKIVYEANIFLQIKSNVTYVICFFLTRLCNLMIVMTSSYIIFLNILIHLF